MTTTNSTATSTDERKIQTVTNADYLPEQHAADRRAAFDRVCGMVALTIAPSSARIYADTYKTWAKWADQNGIDALDVNAHNVIAFLQDDSKNKNGKPTTSATRQRQLSALRKWAELRADLHIFDDGETARVNADILRRIRAPKPETKTTTQERSHHALAPAQVETIQRVWINGTLTARRNTAIIAMLAATGARRAELAALQWRDIDYTRGILTIRHGKRDKTRTIAVVGGGEGFAMRALKAWQTAQMNAAGGVARQFVFCSVGKSDKLMKDAPTNDKTIYRVVEQTAKLAGVEMTPHDLRRTHITEIARVAGITIAQYQAGHSSSSTTTRYVQVSDAEQRHDLLHGVRFGSTTAHDAALFDVPHQHQLTPGN